MGRLARGKGKKVTEVHGAVGSRLGGRLRAGQVNRRQSPDGGRDGPESDDTSSRAPLARGPGPGPWVRPRHARQRRRGRLPAARFGSLLRRLSVSLALSGHFCPIDQGLQNNDFSLAPKGSTGAIHLTGAEAGIRSSQHPTVLARSGSALQSFTATEVPISGCASPVGRRPRGAGLASGPQPGSASIPSWSRRLGGPMKISASKLFSPASCGSTAI